MAIIGLRYSPSIFCEYFFNWPELRKASQCSTIIERKSGSIFTYSGQKNIFFWKSRMGDYSALLVNNHLNYDLKLATSSRFYDQIVYPWRFWGTNVSTSDSRASPHSTTLPSWPPRLWSTSYCSTELIATSRPRLTASIDLVSGQDLGLELPRLPYDQST